MNLKEAEGHFVEAGDWDAAVNMYRSNDLWDEAFRVAKTHGGGPAANRVAYAWALSLGGDAGSKLLHKLGLIEQAIDYALETGAFDHALELARTSLKKKVPHVHLKHALHLEDEGRFKEAEEEFIKASKPKEAIDMYIHQQDWVTAMRVAEAYDPTSISDVLVAQGRVACEGKDYPRAEAHFVDAKKPELALRAYMEARMFPDAIRVAKRHLPHKLHDVNAEIEAQVAGGGHDYVATGRMWEESRNWSLAIDAYLNVSHEQLADPDALEEVWETAVKLASTHEKRRFEEVATAVAQRLMGIGRFTAAGDLLRDVDSPKEAIDCYIRAGAWDKARDVGAKAAKFRDYAETAYQKHLASAGAAEALVDTGDKRAVSTAVDMYVQRGDWARVFDVATKEGSTVFTKYQFTYLAQALDKGKAAQAVSVLAKFGAAPVMEQFDMYDRLFRLLLAGTSETAAPDATIAEAREVLFKVRARPPPARVLCVCVCVAACVHARARVCVVACVEYVVCASVRAGVCACCVRVRADTWGRPPRARCS